jgi:hypothetical protein
MWGGGRKTSDMGASTAGCDCRRLGKRGGGGGGEWGPWARERELTRGNGHASEGKLVPIGWPHRVDGERE